MRELNECTAEVFRRSEKRIKERKRNRNRILALCIPFCLIVTVWSVLTIPAMLPTNDKAMSAEENTGIVGSVNFSTAAFVQVEIETGTTAQSTILKDDANEVAQIYYMMQSSFVTAGEGADEAKDNAMSNVEENKNFSQTANAAASGYKVIFTAENGVKTVFIITKDTLIDESTGRKVTLTEERRSEILTALGLNVTWEVEP